MSMFRLVLNLDIFVEKGFTCTNISYVCKPDIKPKCLVANSDREDAKCFFDICVFYIRKKYKISN